MTRTLDVVHAGGTESPRCLAVHVPADKVDAIAVVDQPPWIHVAANCFGRGRSVIIKGYAQPCTHGGNHRGDELWTQPGHVVDSGVDGRSAQVAGGARGSQLGPRGQAEIA